MNIAMDNVIETFETQAPESSEVNRFLSILKRHARSPYSERAKSRAVIVAYLKFSPNSDKLINELIMACTALPTVDNADIAIDILSQLGEPLLDYAKSFLWNDIRQYSKLYGKSYEPNAAYWHILLRSVARCSADKIKSFRLISACRDAGSYSIIETVIEALGDLGTPDAKALLQRIAETHHERLVRALANETFEDCNALSKD